jgi:hypothetical protein
MAPFAALSLRPAWQAGIAVLLFALLGSCGGGSPTAPTPVPPALPTLAIATQSLPDARLGQSYADAVHASGGDGAYSWEVSAGALPTGLSLSAADLGADHALITGTPQAVGTSSFTLRVRSGDGQSAQRAFTLVVHPEAEPISIQSRRLPPALAGSPYAVPLRASGGDGASYSWEVVEGRLPSGLSLTGAGRIEGVPAAPDAATFVVEVRSGGLSARSTFTLQVVGPDAAAYRLTLFAVSDLPPGIQPHLDAAVARLEAAVVGNLPIVTMPEDFFAAGDCGGFGWMMNGTSTDDLLIALNIESIDGPGGILAQAAPCGIRSQSRLPFVGVVILDADDIIPLRGTEMLTDIITHEIAHVLGFGALWELFGQLRGANTNDPRYTGAGAVAEYQALGGVGEVPVEDQGGEGTRDAHWRKNVFGPELMTGFLEPGGMPMSRVTVASLADLGYPVNLVAADDFALGAALLLHEMEHLGRDEVLRGRVLSLGEDGRVEVLELR